VNLENNLIWITKLDFLLIMMLFTRNCTKLEPLPGEVPANPDDLWIQLVRWSPQGHSLAFVFSNNLYYRANDGTIQKLTDDGSPGIFNGIADWVYEGEI